MLTMASTPLLLEKQAFPPPVKRNDLLLVKEVPTRIWRIWMRPVRLLPQEYRRVLPRLRSKCISDSILQVLRSLRKLKVAARNLLMILFLACLLIWSWQPQDSFAVCVVMYVVAGPSSGQSASARSVSRALKYNTHQTAPAGPVGLGNARSQPQLNSITRTPSLPKCGPPQQSIAEQQFDLEEDPTFWRDHNVQVSFL